MGLPFSLGKESIPLCGAQPLLIQPEVEMILSLIQWGFSLCVHLCLASSRQRGVVSYLGLGVSTLKEVGSCQSTTGLVKSAPSASV